MLGTVWKIHKFQYTNYYWEIIDLTANFTNNYSRIILEKKITKIWSKKFINQSNSKLNNDGSAVLAFLSTLKGLEEILLYISTRIFLFLSNEEQNSFVKRINSNLYFLYFLSPLFPIHTFT